MDYTPAPEKTKESVDIQDVMKFYINYMRSENLGVIANTHLAMSDLLGIDH